MHSWRMAAYLDKQSVLETLANGLSAAVSAHTITILARDRHTGRYRGPVTGAKSGIHAGVLLEGDDPAIERLLAGEQWAVRSPGGYARDDAAPVTAVFPVSVRDSLDHLVMITGGPLSEADAGIVTAYCNQAALAIETMAMQEDLDRKIERLSSLVRLADDFSVGRDYRNLLQKIMERSAELLRAEQCSIMLIERETNELLVEASKGAFGAVPKRARVPKGEGIAGWVAEQGEPVLVADIEHDPRIGKKSRTRYKTASFVSVPLKIDNKVVGVMNFTDKATGELFDDEDLQIARTCASQAAVVLDRKEMTEQAERLRKEAMIDHLTGLLNRGNVLHRLQEELARSNRYEKTMSLILVDVDRFKHINDQCGHPAGDHVLRRIAELMKNAVRSADIIGRYGGDEFMVILPETDAFYAAHLADRVREDIAAADLARAAFGSSAVRITVSIGIATFPYHGTSAEVLVEHADEALYRAKAGGRDRVVVY